MLCAKCKFGKNWPCECRHYVFAILLLHYLKKALSFIWTNLNFLYPRMLCACFSWNWHSGSAEQFLVNNFQSIRKGRAPSLEQNWISFTQGCIAPCLIEIKPVGLERGYLISYMNIRFHPLGRRACLSYILTYFPYTHQEYYVPS